MKTRWVAPPLILTGAIAVCYVNALSGAFQFDDYNVIVDNTDVHSWAAWLASMPGIRPLLKLSYTLSWSCAGGSAHGFRLFNIACHAANTIMVYAIYRYWIATFGPRDLAVSSVALAAAAVFALHPAQTEAVTYISGRSVSLMALFYLSSVLAWLHGIHSNRPMFRNWVSPLLFACALLTKETAWTLPLLLLIWQRVESGASWRTAIRRSYPHWTVLAAAATAMAATPGYRRLLEGSLAARPLSDNLLTQISAQFYLLTEPLLRLRLNIDPVLPVETQLTPALASKAAILLGLLAAAVYALRRQPAWGLTGVWFFLHLLPTNSVLPRVDVANDRQVYLALAGPALLVSLALYRLCARPLAIAAVATIAIVLGGATARRNTDYASEISLWLVTVRDAPNNARAWNNLGYAQQLAGHTDSARSAYLRALALDPSQIKARANLLGLDSPGPAPSP